MMRRNNPKSVPFLRFTLVEVVVALGILAISLATLFQIIASSRSRIAKAEEEWRNTHMLTQAAEYVLLFVSTVDDVPEDFFPYRDYSVSITYDEVLDDQIPDEYSSISSQLPLEVCTIELFNLAASGKKSAGYLTIERIIYEDEGLEPQN